ncbi:hypothetical protein [Streptomyces sp. NPDC005143]
MSDRSCSLYNRPVVVVAEPVQKQFRDHRQVCRRRVGDERVDHL